MTRVQSLEPNQVFAAKNQNANYNAVKIQVNDPRTNIPEGFRPSEEDSGIYNAVDIVVNRPSVNVRKTKEIYSYPQSNGIVTYDMANIDAIANLPAIPVAYQTNLINNRTFVNAEIEFENCDKSNCCNENEEVESKIPEPNVTTTEEQKQPKIDTVTFNGLSFKGADSRKDKVDISKVVENLSSSNFDTQALQIEEIAKTIETEPDKALDYVNTEVFTKLIDILQKDTTKLEAPTKEQNEIREKFMINQLILLKAEQEKEDISKVELPFKLSEEEMMTAIKLSPMEEAERNKEYALYGIAALSRLYTEEVKKLSGNTVPFTDLPGVSEIIETIRKDNNPGIKIAAMESLVLLLKPEYKEEILATINLATKDKDSQVGELATILYNNLKEAK